MAPEYTRPKSPVSSEWPSGPAYQEPEGQPGDLSMAELSWRDFFADDKLQGLLALALENNRDLREAALTIERARAQYRIQRAELYPFINASGSGSVERQPESFSPTGDSETVEQYSAAVGLSSYELDFFGRVRSLRDQALQQFFATEAARRSVQISLVGEVARGWLILAADRELLDLARETLKSHQATYDLTQRRFEVGVASALEVRQAQTTVESTRVDIARYTGLVAEDENALRLLAGASLPPELLPESLTAVTDLKEIAAGLPSEVLRHRPDILAAEHQLQGAYANIGAARAAFFPRIALTAAAGLASDDLTGLFESGSGTWIFSPRLDLPIFNAGSLRARLMVSQVDREIFLARYERAIQSGFREVADALAQRGTLDNQMIAQQALVDATAETYRLSEVRFSKGIDSFLNVLDSQRSFYSARQNLIGIRLLRLANEVTLYRVLGGGAV
jgi:multidrug efflux system outer membrane protein